VSGWGGGTGGAGPEQARALPGVGDSAAERVKGRKRRSVQLRRACRQAAGTGASAGMCGAWHHSRVLAVVEKGTGCVQPGRGAANPVRSYAAARVV
jgi:hypothetical protein